jgi:hypothetical protein
MGVAALISWLVTAFVGLYLLAVWLIETMSRTGAPPPAGCPRRSSSAMSCSP